jgi:hypothetical protein
VIVPPRVERKPVDPREYKIPTYPVVGFLVARDFVLAILIGFVPLIVSMYLASIGWPLFIVVVGAAVSLVLGTLLVSYIEVLRIIADTLMPK